MMLKVLLNTLSLVTRGPNSTILVSFIALTFLSWFREPSVRTTLRHALACLLVMVLLTTSSERISTIMSFLFRDSVYSSLQALSQCTSNLRTSLIKQQSRDKSQKQRSESSAVFCFNQYYFSKSTPKSINNYMKFTNIKLADGIRDDLISGARPGQGLKRGEEHYVMTLTL